jgi:hypothetical protein
LLLPAHNSSLPRIRPASWPEALILCLEADRIRPLAYEETEHFRVTRQFLRNPAKSLAILFDQAPDERSE